MQKLHFGIFIFSSLFVLLVVVKGEDKRDVIKSVTSLDISADLLLSFTCKIIVSSFVYKFA